MVVKSSLEIFNIRELNKIIIEYKEELELCEEREELKKFILGGLTEYGYGRNDYNDDLGNSYLEWKYYNMNLVGKLNEEDVLFYTELMKRIKRKNIGNMDLENMVGWETNGFFFNLKGMLVVFNNR
jgi:hypothetical protein